MAMLLSVFTSLVLVAFSAIGVDSPLGMSGGIVYVVEATLPLLAYGVIAAWAPTLGLRQRGPALQLGTGVGIIGGVLQIILLVLENSGRRIVLGVGIAKLLPGRNTPSRLPSNPNI
jgi:hypothetical protein